MLDCSRQVSNVERTGLEVTLCKCASQQTDAAVLSTITGPVLVFSATPTVGQRRDRAVEDAAETVRITRCYGASPIRLPIVCGHIPQLCDNLLIGLALYDSELETTQR
jgi:hypothetical protein